jgi:hypothetical protein
MEIPFKYAHGQPNLTERLSSGEPAKIRIRFNGANLEMYVVARSDEYGVSLASGISNIGGGGGDFSNGGDTATADRTLGNNSNHALSFETNGANRIHITNDGKVSVGATAPTTPANDFETLGKIGVGDAGVQTASTVNIRSSASPSLSITNGAYTTGKDATFLGIAPSANAYAQNSAANDTVLSAKSGYDLRFGTANLTSETQSVRMTITKDGKVGVGTLAPDEGFHVDDLNVGITADAAPQIRIAAGAEANTGNDSLRAIIGLATAGNNFVNGAANNDLVVRTNPSGGVIIGSGQANLHANFRTDRIDFNRELKFTSNGIAGINLNMLTTAERTGLTNAEGMLVSDTTVKKPYYNDGTAWHELSTVLARTMYATTLEVQRATASTQYLRPTGDILLANEAQASMVMHRAGTIKGMSVNSRTNSSNVDVLFTVRKNTVSQALVLTYPSATSSGTVTQNTDVTFAAGDLITIMVTAPSWTTGSMFVTCASLDIQWS